MATEETATPNAGNGGGPAEDSLFSQLMGMMAALWASRQRTKVIALLIALIAVVGASAYAQVLLNAWNQPFYDALSRKDVAEFVTQLGVFAKLAGALLVLNVAQAWLNLKSKLVLRKGLVEDLIGVWLAPLRAVRLAQAGEIGENPDQRIHEDARHLTELSTDLGIGLLQSTILLLSFVGVLWILSDNMVFTLAAHTFVVPGYMVWCALVYSGIASLASWLVGRPLIRLNTERYAREAQFRYALVRVNEEIEGVTLYGGEADERGRLGLVFRGVVKIFDQIVLATTWLTAVTAGFGWLAIVAPILVAAPFYFYGDTTFGKLMMEVGAFNQVQQALGWFANNFSSIADWRATLLRVAGFRATLLTLDKLGEGQSRIELDGRHEDFDPFRRSLDCDPRRAHRAQRTPPGGQAGRTRSDCRRAGRRTRAVPGDRRALALGRRPHPASTPPVDRLHADARLCAAGVAARVARLSPSRPDLRRCAHSRSA